MKSRMFLSIYLPTIFIDALLRSRKVDLSKETVPIISAVDIRGEKYVARCSRDLMRRNPTSGGVGSGLVNSPALNTSGLNTVGLTPGMKLAQACALFPKAELCEFSEHKERQYLEELAVRAYRYSPICGVDEPPDGFSTLFNHRFVGVNLDLSGSERLFKGYETFLSSLDEQLSALGLFARLSISSSLGAAWAFSRYLSKRRSFVPAKNLREELTDLPIEALRFLPATQEHLERVNVRTIGELLQIPRRSLVTRFGEEVIRRIDQALGVEEELISPVTVRRNLQCKHVFPQPITELEVVRNVASSILAKVQQLLEEHCRVLSRFLLVVERDGAMSVENVFTIHFPSSDRQQILKRLLLYLEKMDLVRGVISVSISVMGSEPQRGRNLSYLASSSLASSNWASSNWASSRDNGSRKSSVLDLEREGVLIDTLKDRLGEKKLLELRYRESHLPERTFTYTALSNAGLSGSGRRCSKLRTSCSASSEGTSSGSVASGDIEDLAYVPASRPSVLFSQPEEIRAMAVIPDSLPFQITWRKLIYRIIRGAGPERISSEWWLVKEGVPVSRDYFKVQINSGVWLWIFRELEHGGWYLHGIWQ